MEDPRKDMRYQAALILADRRDPAALEVLLAITADDKTSWRGFACRALVNYPNDPRVEPAIKSLVGDREAGDEAKDALARLHALQGKGDGAQTERRKVLDTVEAAEEYSLEVAVEGVDGVAHLQIEDIHADYSPIAKKLAADHWVADASYTGRTLIPLVLSTACGGPERGRVQVNVLPKGGKGASTFKSRGPAEDIYILNLLPTREMYEGWLKKVVPTSADVLLSRKDLLAHVVETSEAFQQAQGKRQKAHKVDITADLEPAVTLAKAKYDERRAELIGRLAHSLLFYPKSKDLKWSCDRDGDHVFVSASCNDGWCDATFTVELERADGAWQYRRLLGSEVLKGD